MKTECYHCGQDCEIELIISENKPFCCNGCKTVFEIIHANDLDNFYELNKKPGIKPEKNEAQFNYIDDEKIFNKLVTFHDGGIVVVEFHIPAIHCTSCIWLLESLHKINKNIIKSNVNFSKKTIEITYKSDEYNLSDLVKFLTKIGYKPSISNQNSEEKNVNSILNNSLILKLVVAGFCFGNIMLFTIPDYMQENDLDFDQYGVLFKVLIFCFSLPIVLYSALPYFVSAWYGIKNKYINIDVPIAIGILTLFYRSTYEIITDMSLGYFDSLAGLVFFMLIGKYFQERTYKSMSFDRNYKSFYPIAVCRKKEDDEEYIGLDEVKSGNRLLIRNMEILPADSILIKGKAKIDNSFITGESRLIDKSVGDKIFAGAKQVGSLLEVEVIEEVNQSYLSKLWQKDIFNETSFTGIDSLTNKVSKYFSLAILIIALVSWSVWYVVDPQKSFLVVTSILIIACPCALGLSAPFTMGNAMRILSRMGFYTKDASVLERMAEIDTIVFDKTGTLTDNKNQSVQYEGRMLTYIEKNLVKSLCNQSNHPISKRLSLELRNSEIQQVENFMELPGKGIQGNINGNFIKIGNRVFVGNSLDRKKQTEVHVSINDEYLGRFVFGNSIRENVDKLSSKLSKFSINLLSGDNESEKDMIYKLLPNANEIRFNQSPEDKMDFIRQLQQNKQKVMMFGDGLNDAFALKQSDIGVAISDNVNAFSPASDVIMKADLIGESSRFIKFSKTAKNLVYGAFGISFLYNSVGLYFAISGLLEPKIAAILMPLSSITVVLFAVASTSISAHYIFKKK